MDRRSVSVTLQCFIKDEGRYLMLHRNSSKRIMPNIWMAPGGHRKFCEGLFEATRREVLEETGLEVKNLRIKATAVAYLKDLDQELYLHLMVAEYAGGVLRSDPDEGVLAWLTLEEISKLDDLLSELRQILPYIFNDGDKVISYKVVYEEGNKMVGFTLEES